MTDFRLYSNDDDEVARGLRSLYAAPAGDAYWNELQARIMARVADVELGWWNELDRWVRPALAAAAVLLIAAGVAMFRAHEVEGDIAAENMLSSPAVPVSTAIRPALQDDREARIRFLFFLLGAVLVGGAVGFSADRYIGHEKFATQYGPRVRFYDELGLNPQQRTTMDSLAFQQDCAVRQILAPHDSILKAIRTRFQAQRDSVLTKDQLTRMETRRKEMQSRREAEQAKEPKRTCN